VSVFAEAVENCSKTMGRVWGYTGVNVSVVTVKVMAGEGRSGEY
jgi:hypothetical protein